MQPFSVKLFHNDFRFVIDMMEKLVGSFVSVYPLASLFAVTTFCGKRKSLRGRHSTHSNAVSCNLLYSKNSL